MQIERQKGKKGDIRFREKIHRAFGQTRDLRRLLVNMYLPRQERPHNLREFRSRCSFTYLHKPRRTLPHMEGEEG